MFADTKRNIGVPLDKDEVNELISYAVSHGFKFSYRGGSFDQQERRLAVQYAVRHKFRFDVDILKK